MHVFPVQRPSIHVLLLIGLQGQLLDQLRGGLTHTTTFISENIDDIRTRGDVATELYNACEHRERTQTMTVSYYPRTWILTGVQVSGS